MTPRARNTPLSQRRSQRCTLDRMGGWARLSICATALLASAPAQATASTAASASAPSPAPSWEALEDLRILTNEEPADYAPRLEALLQAFREVPVDEVVARSRDASKLRKLRRARLTLARAQLTRGDEAAALRTLATVQRENVGVDVDFAAMGPSLAALAERADPRQGLAPIIRCDRACSVIVEGREVSLDTEGNAQVLPFPVGTYEFIIAEPSAAVEASPEPRDDVAPERFTVVISEGVTNPAALTWPPAGLAPTNDADAALEPHPQTLGHRRNAALGLGITGGILAIVGGVLIGVRPGCDTAPCTTAPAVLAGIGAVSAGIPLLAGALTLGLIRDRPSPSDAQARYRLVLQGRF